MTRRLGRRFAISGGLVLAGFGLIVLGVYGFAQTESGRAWIAKTAAAMLSVPGQAVVSVERLDGRLPQQILLSGVSLRDDAGLWLSAARVELEWRPLALLSRDLHVTSLRVIDLEVERPPMNTGGIAKDEPGGIPSLPVDITVERLSVEDVRLGSAVLGQAASFRIKGEAAFQDIDRFTSSLVIERTDGVLGRAELTAAYLSRDDRLSLDARLDEPAGGLIAHALDVPDLPAVQARVSGDGPLSQWVARASVTLEELASIEANVALERREALRFRIDGETSTKRPLRDLPWIVLAGDQTFEAEGAWRRDRVVALDRMRIEGPVARLEAEGTLVAATLEIDARARARLKEPSLVEALAPGVTIEGLNIDTQLKGALQRPKVDATISADRLAAPGIEAKSANARFTFKPTPSRDASALQGKISANGEFDDLVVEDLRDIQAMLDGRLTWRVSGILDVDKQSLDAEDLLAQSGPTRVAGRGTFRLAEGTSQSDLRFTFDDLTGLGPLIGIGVQGRGEMDAQVETDGFGQQIKAHLVGNLRDMRLDEPVVQALLADQASLAANLTYAPDRPLTLSGIEVETPAARLTGDAAFLDGFDRLDARYKMALPKAAALSQSLGVRLSGQARVEGAIAGKLSNPELQGQLALTTARIEEFDFGRLDLAFGARDLPTAPRGRLDLAATPSFGKIEAGADYVFADPELRLTGLSVQGLGGRAQGALTLPTDGRPLSGTLEIRAADLAPWLAMAGLGGGGAANAELRLSGDGPRQVARLDLDATDLGLKVDEESPLTAQSLRILLETSDLMESRTGIAELAATGLILDDLRLGNATLTAQGTPVDAVFQLAVKGSFRGPLALDAAGRLRTGPDELLLEVAKTAGQALGQPVKLRGPFSMARRGDKFEVTGLDLAFGEARVSADAGIGPQRIAVDLDVEALPLVSLVPFVPIAGITGTAAAEVTVKGTRDKPTGTARVTLNDVRSELIHEGPAFGLDASAAWRDGRLAISGRLSGTPERNAELSADLPLRLAPNRMALLAPPDDPISGQLSWHGPMGSIWPLVPLEGHLLDGQTDLAVELGGSVAAPKITGSARISGGRYESLDSGSIVEDLDLRIGFNDGRAVLSKLTGNDGGSGSVSVTGEMTLDGARNHPFKLHAEMTEFAAIRRDDVTAVTDGTLRFEGSITRAALTGGFQTRSVEIRIVDRLPADVATLDVVETDSDGKLTERPEDGERKDAGPEIGLDVAVAMPKRVFVRGRGLDSEWSGNLNVTGTTDAPRIEGDLNLVRGQLSVLARSFRLRHGSVRFAGGAEVMPELDVVAEHKAKELVVTARVSGPATNPAIELSSAPALPQDEILSRILFGKSRGQLSALEAAQLASAVAELTGTGAGVGSLDFARSLLGVDRLAVGTAGTGDTAAPAVEAGKYVTEEVYIGVKKGVTDQSGAVGIEVEITPNISVESETGTTGESNIGVKFKWDY